MLPILAQEEDSSEEDEDLQFHQALQDAIKAQTRSVITDNEQKFSTYESSDFMDAQKAIIENCWNSNAWELLIEEVESGRGGKLTKVEAYLQATSQFPRAWKFWKKLVDNYLDAGEVQPCEEAFRKCLQKCRNVDLWLSYLNLTRQKTVDKHPPNSEQYANAKRMYEAAFEKALDNIGMSFDSHLIWRRYLDFVKEWPESGAIDAGRKLTALREIYQKAICNPMDDLDRYWREYEELEMKAGEHLATQLLPEFKPKHVNAKNVFKERKRMSQSIQLDRVSIPPSTDGSVSEVQQLELWNKWIRYEMDNPDRLADDQHRQYMRLLYDKCLCCFRLHPEVWLSLARYELSTPNGIIQARAVLKEALTTLPQSTILWLELSELEESYNGVDAAVEVLRNAFEQVPSAFTFALLQRIVRRRDGKSAARKIFAETIGMRHEGILGFECYLAHASLELDVNNEPEVGLKILGLARSLHPVTTNNLHFLKLMTRILVRLGDVRQLRWVYQIALGGSNLAQSSTASDPSLSTLLIQPIRKQVNGFTLDEQYNLWKDYLDAELTFGMSDVARLNQLRDRIRAIRSVFDESKLKSASHDYLTFGSPDVFNLYEPVLDIFCRCERILFCLPPTELALRDRSRGVNFLNDLIQRADDRMVTLMETGLGKKKIRREGDGIDSNILSGVPIFLRDLLSRLPPHTGPPPDIETFVEHLKRTVLPPRPVTEERDESSNSGGGIGLGSGSGSGSGINSLTNQHKPSTAEEDDVILLPGSKRKGNFEDDENDDEDEMRMKRADDDNRDDIFKQRCRLRMSAE